MKILVATLALMVLSAAPFAPERWQTPLFFFLIIAFTGFLTGVIFFVLAP